MIQSPRPGPGDMTGDWGNLLNTLAKLFSPILPIEKRSIRSRAAEPICCLVPLSPQPQPQLSHKHCIQSSPSNKPPLGGDLRPGQTLQWTHGWSWHNTAPAISRLQAPQAEGEGSETNDQINNVRVEEEKQQCLTAPPPTVSTVTVGRTLAATII